MTVRRALAGASLLVPPLAIVLSWLAWRDRLPARVASHWTDLGAPPDGTSTTTSLLVGTVIATGLIALAGLVVATVPMRAAARRGTLGTAGFLGGIVAGGWLVPAGLTLRTGSPYDTVLGGWVLLLVACGAFALVPYFLMPREAVVPAGVG